MREQPEWKEITPEHLHAAIEHIRKDFEVGRYAWSEATARFCRCSLHPDLANPKLVSENEIELRQCLRLLGSPSQHQFQRLTKLATPPSIFLAHFDLYYEMLVLLQAVLSFFIGS